MEAEWDSGKCVDSRGRKNPRDQALLRELREEEKELKDEEKELIKDMPEHQRLDLYNSNCSSIKQSRDLLDRIERNAQRQLAVTDEIRRLSEQMRAVKARSLTEETAAALDEHGDAANGREWMVENVDDGGDEEHMDCDISSMEDQVPRIDSKSDPEAEAAPGPDHTNESMIESNISVSDKIILINRGNDVVDQMDRGKSAEQLLNEAEKMAAEQKEFALYADAWDDKWGSSGFGLFHYMSE